MMAFERKRGWYAFCKRKTSTKVLLKWLPTWTHLCLILPNFFKAPIFIYRISVIYRTFLNHSYDKPKYFCNVFDAQILLPSSYFLVLQNYSWKCSPYFNYTKTTFISCSSWSNYGRDCALGKKEIIIFWLKSIRALFLCKSRHLWKRSIVRATGDCRMRVRKRTYHLPGNIHLLLSIFLR